MDTKKRTDIETMRQSEGKRYEKRGWLSELKK